MSKRIVWLPGWASNFAQWEQQIRTTFPEAEHYFADYARMVRERDHLHEWPEVVNADLVIGWSLGSMLTLRIASKLPKGTSLLLLCPFAWFCDPELGWHERVVMRMAAQLRKDSKAVIIQFAKLMGATDEVTRKEWIQRASAMDVEVLACGLEVLASQCATHLELLSSSCTIHLIAGAQDELVSPELVVNLERELHPQSIQIIANMNHWPFSADWATIFHKLPAC